MAPYVAEQEKADEIPLSQKFLERLPPASKDRLLKANVDLSKGYPWLPDPPIYVDEVYQIRNHEKCRPLHSAF
jgi:hypothetical protein